MVLSICIPSYNRWDVLNKNIESITKAKSHDFEVVIVDNCSPKDPKEMLNLSDPRVRVVRRKEAVYGPYNVANSLTFAEGEYALLCLDKDMVIGDGIDRFVACLREHGSQNVTGGVCRLNVPQNEGNYELVSKNAILRFGYTSIHATGPFCKTEIVKQYEKTAPEEVQNSGFSYEYYLAKCASLGSMIDWGYPLLQSRLANYSDEDKNASGKSLAFSEKNNNLYFFPKNRINEFLMYIKALSELDLDKSVYKKKIRQLYRITIRQVTLDYKRFVENEDHAFHYHFRKRHVTIKNMLENYNFLNTSFREGDIKDITYVWKLRVILETLLFLPVKLVMLKVKKLFGEANGGHK